jgi:hypothetical protein
VANADTPQLRNAVMAWQQACNGSKVVVSGPWPAFSFVDQAAASI